MKFRISKQAARDLEDIWLYTCEAWSIAQANRYFDLLLDEMEYIATYPHSGKDYSEIKKEYFRSNVKSHAIFYRIIQNQNEIEIIRILHQRMDIKDRLDE